MNDNESENVEEELNTPIRKEYIAPNSQSPTDQSDSVSYKKSFKPCLTVSLNKTANPLVPKLDKECPICKLNIPKHVKNHVYTCLEVKIKCELDECEWIGPRQLITDHIHTKHKYVHLQSGNKYKSELMLRPCIVLKSNKHYFWLRRKSIGEQYFWSAHSIYAWEANQKFHFTITVEGNDVLYKFTQPCKPNSIDKRITKDDCIGLKKSLLSAPNDIYIEITDKNREEVTNASEQLECAIAGNIPTTLNRALFADYAKSDTNIFWQVRFADVRNIAVEVDLMMY